MLKFDRIKFVAPLQALTSLNEDWWSITLKRGKVTELTFKQESPCLIRMKANRIEDKLVVEFTGKILKDDYPQLINRNSIRKCLDAINALGVCTLDVEFVIKNADVTLCDVTTDITINNYAAFKTTIETNIKNLSKWTVKNYGRKNFTIEKNVKTPKMKRRMSVYDKEEELHTCTDFLNWVSNPNEIRNHFIQKTRFELNLRTRNAIKKELGISACTLMDVLCSGANPHISFFENLVKSFEPSVSINVNKSMRLFDKESTLIRFDWQLQPIEMLYRQRYPDSFRNSLLDDYRELLKEHNRTLMQKIDFHALFDSTTCSSTTPITPVDAEYWSNSTEIPSWGREGIDSDYSFISDRPCAAPQSVLQ